MKFCIERGRFIMIAALACGSTQADSVTLSPLFVSIGPNPNTPSPSYAGYTYNAQYGVSAAGVDVGGNINSTPTAYNVLGSGGTATVALQSVVGTPFASWLGVADPSGPLRDETGNCIFWSLEITGTPGKNDISLSQLSFSQSSTDPLDYFGITGSYASFAYAPDAVGILANGHDSGSGSPDQDVNEIIITDFGSYLDGNPAVTGYPLTGNDAVDLQAIDSTFSSALGNFSIDTCFAYGTASTCDAVTVVGTPEPPSVIIFILGLSLLILSLPRGRHQV